MNKKDITVVNDTPDNYVPYTSEQIKGDSKTAFKAAMEILFAHSADVFTCIVDIIAEKYELEVDDIMKTIVSHPKYNGLSIHPVIRSLSYFNQEDCCAASAAPVKKVLKIVRKTPAKK
jgi:hypothetical protein